MVATEFCDCREPLSAAIALQGGADGVCSNTTNFPILAAIALVLPKSAEFEDEDALA